MMKIQEVILLASELEQLKYFYHETLGLPLQENTSASISFVAGASVLTFKHDPAVIRPYYHFAFNISANKFDSALDWLKQKGIAINLVDGSEVVYSKSWNSHSVYFYDPVENIVEFIARHNLSADSSTTEFSAQDILNISEIGIPAEDVLALSKQIQNYSGEEIYQAGDSIFTPIGDEEGLFILSALTRNWLGSAKKVAVFSIRMRIRFRQNTSDHLLDYP